MPITAPLDLLVGSRFKRNSIVRWWGYGKEAAVPHCTPESVAAGCKGARGERGASCLLKARGVCVVGESLEEERGLVEITAIAENLIVVR